MCNKIVNSSEALSLTEEELQDFLKRMEGIVSPGDFEIIKGLANTTRVVNQVLEEKDSSIKSLREMLFGARTEKTKDVLKEETEPEKEPTSQEDGEAKKKPKGHGRNGAAKYVGAEKVPVPHESLQPSDDCPSCTNGKVYSMKSGQVIRITGQAPLEGKVYEPEKLRCNLCGEVFTAELPEEAGPEKYDEKAGSTIAILKYGSGLPFYRLEKLQKSLGIPLPAATQWEIVKEAAEKIAPVFDELVRQAAQGEVIYNDDTNMKILGFPEKKNQEVSFG
jgi:transposase